MTSRSRGTRGCRRVGGSRSACRTSSSVSSTVAPAERRQAGEALVEDRAERVDVAAGRPALDWPSACSGAM